MTLKVMNGISVGEVDNGDRGTETPLTTRNHLLHPEFHAMTERITTAHQFRSLQHYSPSLDTSGQGLRSRDARASKVAECLLK